jgi:rare lipoprotein A
LPKGVASLDVGLKDRGIASWYGPDFDGWATANGEIYDMYAMTAAHRTLPLGSLVKVTNVKNGKQIRVRINDRGPYANGRILDLSYGAAAVLEMTSDGVGPVQVEVVAASGLAQTAEGWSELTWWETAGLEHPVSPDRRSYQHRPREIRFETWTLPASRQVPTDIMLDRRSRRVADILAAEQRVDAVAELILG